MARVLVLEDDMSLREALAVMLGALGHEPVEASTLTAARCHQAEAPCDLILLDLDVEGGCEGLRQLQAAHPDVPILTTDCGTGLDPETVPGARVRRVDNPFDLGELHDSVERALDQER